MTHPPVRAHRLATLVLAAALPLCLACSGNATTPSAPAAPDNAAAGPATPKVSRLVMSVNPPARTDADLRFLAPPSVWYVRPMYDFLLDIDPKTDKILPGLVAAWNLEPNGQSFRLKLRDIPFHGTWGPVRAEDIKFGWEQLVLPDSVHGQQTYWKQLMKSFEIVNDREIIFHLTAPDSQFVTAISEQQGGLEVRSKANYDATGAPTWKTGPLAGSGPYQFKAGAEGQYIRYERNPAGHYKGVPDFPEFEFRMAKEASTRLARLLTGEAHMADLPQDLVATATGRGMQTIRGTFPGTRLWGAFQGGYVKDIKDLSKGYLYPDSPLVDRRVRQALNKAINRDEMNKAFFGGKAETMILNHFHPSRAGWNPEWERKFQDQYGYDPAAAKRLLAEAGQANWKATMSVLALPGVSGGQDLTEAVAGYWKAVGIDVALVTPDAAEETRLSRAYTYTDRLSLRASGNNLWSGFIVWNSSTGNRGNGFEDIEVDRVLSQIPVTMADTAREALWRKVGDLAFADMLSVHLFYLPAEAVVDPKIVGGWAFPGDITGSWTHIVNVKAAR